MRHNSSWVTMSSDYVYDKSMSRHSHHCIKIKFSIKDLINVTTSAQKMKFSIKDFFSKYDLKKSLMENFIFQCIIDLFSGKIYPSLILKTPNKLFWTLKNTIDWFQLCWVNDSFNKKLVWLNVDSSLVFSRILFAS